MTDAAILCILDNLCNEARNSMHAAYGLLELPRDPSADGKWQTCLESGRASADRLLRAIDDVRELLAGPPAAESGGAFDLSVCLRETIEVLNLANGEGYGSVTAGITPKALPIRQDRRAVEQVLIRILHAARKLAGAGWVRAQGALLKDGFRLTIDASEAGAAECLLDWMNADPGQACFPTSAAAPLAVGVMVAGKRIRALGGTTRLIVMENAPAALVIDLPMAAPAVGDPDGAARGPGIGSETLNVLMAEDCDESYALTELLLRNENVWRARDGLEALDMVTRQRFDIVFMDIHMPGLDGYQAIRKIREWETGTGNARTPIIVLSSDDLETQRRSAAQSGCSGFLRKPLRNGELFDVLNRLKAARSLAADGALQPIYPRTGEPQTLPGPGR